MLILRNGLNKDFYQWIDDVRRSFRKKDELAEELKKYEQRLNSYNAVSFDSIGPGTSGNNVENNLLYTIGKIEEVTAAIKKVTIKIDEYYRLVNTIDIEKRKILHNIIFDNYSIRQIANNYDVSKNRIYTVINKLMIMLKKKEFNIKPPKCKSHFNENNM